MSLIPPKNSDFFIKISTFTVIEEENAKVNRVARPSQSSNSVNWDRLTLNTQIQVGLLLQK